MFCLSRTTLTGTLFLLSEVSADIAPFAGQMERHFLFVCYAFWSGDCLFLQAKIRHLY
jgi:hypothetical protein